MQACLNWYISGHNPMCSLYLKLRTYKVVAIKQLVLSIKMALIFSYIFPVLYLRRTFNHHIPELMLMFYRLITSDQCNPVVEVF